MYKLKFTQSFWDAYEKVTKNNSKLKKRIKKSLELLTINPTFPSLKSHKVETKKYGIKFSSFVTGDIRVVWDFDKEGILAIKMIDIGGHSGKNKVYK